MPNRIRVNGFRPHIEGSGRVQVTSHAVLVGNSRVITTGDAVSAVADGSNYGSAVTRGAANDGSVLAGVASHFFYVDSGNVGRPSARIPASQAGRCYVFDDPFQKFIGYGAGTASVTATVASVVTHLGETCLLSDQAGVALSTSQGSYGGYSLHGLDVTSVTTGPQDFQLLERYDVTDNAFGSSTTDNLNGGYVCKFFEHYYLPATGRTTGI